MSRVSARPSAGALTLIDRYLLRLLVAPLTASLGVVLTALLMERLLRLFDLLAESGGRAGVVVELLANLVPHYLGLALPAAFFFSVLAVMTRLSEGSESDALQACGVSIGRLSTPFILVGCALAVLSLAIFGYMQPLSRYAYRAVLHDATSGEWTSRVQPQVVLRSPDGFTLTADTADVTGRRLGGVFLRRMTERGEEVITAGGAVLRVSADGRRLSARLRDGTQFADRGPIGGPVVTAFDQLDLVQDLGAGLTPYRVRGANARELTLSELWSRMGQTPPSAERAEFASEFYARLARALSLPFLPLLAIPLGLSAKRRQSGARLVIAGVTLLAYHQLLQLGESLGDTGAVPPPIAVWTPFLLFAAFSLWLFTASRKRAGDTPLSRIVERLGRRLEALRHAAARLRPQPATA